MDMAAVPLLAEVGSDEPDARPGSGGPAAQGPALVSSGTLSGSDFHSPVYNMNHTKRGTAIIFNNKCFDSSTAWCERIGTDVDCQNLKNLFQQMGFNVKTHNNATQEEMKSTMVKLVSKKDHRDADCFACAILSYGEEGIIYGRDGQPISIEELVGPLKGDQLLAGKPKLFFIQACPPEEEEEADFGGVDEGVTQSDAVRIKRIPKEADFLIAYSVVPGSYAWSSSKQGSQQGSFFIQALVDVLQKDWQRTDLLSMMTKVCGKVSKYAASNSMFKKFLEENPSKDIPCITSTLSRELHFTPKK